MTLSQGKEAWDWRGCVGVMGDWDGTRDTTILKGHFASCSSRGLSARRTVPQQGSLGTGVVTLHANYIITAACLIASASHTKDGHGAVEAREQAISLKR
jgi:hypothetical protein